MYGIYWPVKPRYYVNVILFWTLNKTPICLVGDFNAKANICFNRSKQTMLVDI